MSFDKHIFSTTTSIANIEQNINSLSGTKKVQSVLGNATTTKIKVSDDVSYVIFTDNNFNNYTVSALSNEAIIPAQNITSCITYDIDDVARSSYSFSYGYGYYAYSQDDNTDKLEIVNANWQLVPEKSSWTDKIAVAKTEIEAVLKNYLKTDFSKNGRYSFYDLNRYVVTYNQELLDIINNLDIFNTASDYLVLYMIYRDLALGGNNSQYQAKADNYKQAYYQELDKNLQLIDIDLDADGQTDIEFYDTNNRIII